MKKRPQKQARKVVELPPPKRMPVRRCTHCGYIISELEWQAMRFYLPCPCCGGRSFERTMLP